MLTSSVHVNTIHITQLSLGMVPEYYACLIVLDWELLNEEMWLIVLTGCIQTLCL